MTKIRTTVGLQVQGVLFNSRKSCHTRLSVATQTQFDLHQSSKRGSQLARLAVVVQKDLGRFRALMATTCQTTGITTQCPDLSPKLHTLCSNIEIHVRDANYMSVCFAMRPALTELTTNCNFGILGDECDKLGPPNSYFVLLKMAKG